MPWFKVDDGFHSNPKALSAGTPALGLWVRCGSWAAQHLTDGFVPANVVRLYGTAAMAKALVAAGLWSAVDGGYRFHDYLAYNPTREKVEGEREAAAERQREARERARRKREEQQASRRDATVTDTDPSRCDFAVSHATVTRPSRSPRPDPTRTSYGSTNESASHSLHQPAPVEAERVTAAEFADWWRAYPRRVGKQAAEKAYRRARRTVSAARLLAAAERFRDDPTRDPAFTAHPATWLHQGRWDDEGPARPVPRNPAEDRTAHNLALVEQFAKRENAAQSAISGPAMQPPQPTTWRPADGRTGPFPLTGA